MKCAGVWRMPFIWWWQTDMFGSSNMWHSGFIMCVKMNMREPLDFCSTLYKEQLCSNNLIKKWCFIEFCWVQGVYVECYVLWYSNYYAIVLYSFMQVVKQSAALSDTRVCARARVCFRWQVRSTAASAWTLFTPRVRTSVCWPPLASTCSCTRCITREESETPRRWPDWWDCDSRHNPEGRAGRREHLCVCVDWFVV